MCHYLALLHSTMLRVQASAAASPIADVNPVNGRSNRTQKNKGPLILVNKRALCSMLILIPDSPEVKAQISFGCAPLDHSMKLWHVAARRRRRISGRARTPCVRGASVVRVTVFRGRTSESCRGTRSCSPIEPIAQPGRLSPYNASPRPPCCGCRYCRSGSPARRPVCLVHAGHNSRGYVGFWGPKPPPRKLCPPTVFPFRLPRPSACFCKQMVRFRRAWAVRLRGGGYEAAENRGGKRTASPGDGTPRHGRGSP